MRHCCRVLSRKLVVALPVSFVLMSGCLTGSVQRAQTVGAKNWEISIEPGAMLLPGSGKLPTLNGAFRYGLTDRIDIGARAGTALMGASGKFLLTPPAHPWLALSVAPSFGADH